MIDSSTALIESADPRDQVRLPAGYYERNSAFGYLHVLPDLAVLFTAVWLLEAATLPWRVLLSLGIGVVGYRLTFVVHDCSHRTLFSRRAENELFGWVTASVLVISFSVFRHLHWVHHQHYGRAEDPQGIDYNGLVPGRDRVLWHLLQPLLLLNIIDKASRFFALKHCGMTAQEQRAGLEKIGMDSVRERLPAAIAIGIAQSGVFLVASHLGASPILYLWFVVPLVTVGLFLSRVRSYLEHGWLDGSQEGTLVARTHRSNLLERNVLSGLFFNYHNEHHRWPQVPSRNLASLHREITHGRIPAREYGHSYLRSLGQLLGAARNLRRT